MNEPRRAMAEEEAGRTFQWSHRPQRVKHGWLFKAAVVLVASIIAFGFGWAVVTVYAVRVGW